MTGAAPNTQEREAFYAAAMVGLRALDARERAPRRFGQDADARWAQFAGALGAGDRIDILLKDAASWGAAFSPAECFGLFGLADDELFGPDWSSLPDQVAKKHFGERAAVPTIDDAAAALGLQVAAIDLPALTPATKLVAAGPAAIVAVAHAFHANKALSWTDQVLVVSSLWSTRQLAGLAAVILGARGRTTIVRPGADASALRSAGFAHVDLAVVSQDAEPDAADFARTLGSK